MSVSDRDFIEWPYPEALLRFLRRKLMVLLPAGFICFLVLLGSLYFIGHKRSPLHTALYLGSATVVVAFLFLHMRATYRSLAQTRYALHATGAKMDPGFTAKWDEVKAVSVEDGFAGTRVLVLHRGTSPNPRKMVFDPAVVDEHELVAFANTRIPSADRASPNAPAAKPPPM